MSEVYRQPTLKLSLSRAISARAQKIGGAVRDAEPYVVIWWMFAACVAASQASRFYGDALGPLNYLLTVAGAAGCGWLWLLSRTLFRTETKLEAWTLFAVLAIIVVESYWQFTSGISAGGLKGEMRRIGENAASLVCIGAIAMFFVEALSQYSQQKSLSERRFRRTFVSVLGAAIFISMILLGGASDTLSAAGAWREPALAACAFLAVAASRLAVDYRRRNPLPSMAGKSRRQPVARDTAAETALARQIVKTVEERELFTTPNLKVAQLSDRLGEKEYKVTRCITGELQFRNFNHFINSYRIEHAKSLLAELPDQPILSIAFECGFNSIGPFNRAFKQHAGMTPREFRAGRSD